MAPSQLETARKLAEEERPRRVREGKDAILPDQNSIAVLKTLRQQIEAIEKWLGAACTESVPIRACALMEAANAAQSLRFESEELVRRIEVFRNETDPWRLPVSQVQH
ncbi:hypothetical protein FPY71_13335 [Aureimonas fodinaquatilis]|uniref:Uncharacterized protein n=1 Tax=Aureimonas fodinaquatilis TaxID=2565783 RepID=A0A5B0DU97_9HYPH|nr:hypothetical protein [Aureimonas fodinaquatilis]KAA0969515.1 hypothetical protein FPY71_13335 [Aureimonas fodinaquatilis]